jgi:dihydrofolate synthase / folylpolyglutamate synthase
MTIPLQQIGIDPSDSEQQHSLYEHWVRRLYLTNMFHPVKLGLENMQRLMDALQWPARDICTIHVAGTNGKGSVTYKLAQALQGPCGAVRVGLFCSPHVASFRERMSINGQLISEDDVVELLPFIYQQCRKHDIPATFFEITTALALAYFAKYQVHVICLETGLGGRLDATNVIERPALSIITSIGLEHTRILGDTIELIAMEKAGIMKPSCPGTFFKIVASVHDIKSLIFALVLFCLAL